MVIPSLPADGCSPAMTLQTHQTHRYVVHLFCSDLCLNISQERSRWKNITIKKYKSWKITMKRFMLCAITLINIFYVQNCSQVRIFQSRSQHFVEIFLNYFLIRWSFWQRICEQLPVFFKVYFELLCKKLFFMSKYAWITYKILYLFLLNSSSGGDGKIKIYWIEKIIVHKYM